MREQIIPRAATALEDELERQYRASDWEQAKDVMEGVDYCRLVEAAMPALIERNRLRRIEAAARTYYAGYCVDEAASRDCCVDDAQHRAAQDLRDALAQTQEAGGDA